MSKRMNSAEELGGDNKRFMDDMIAAHGERVAKDLERIEAGLRTARSGNGRMRNCSHCGRPFQMADSHDNRSMCGELCRKESQRELMAKVRANK